MERRLDFTLIFAEACLQLLFYWFVAGMLGMPPIINPGCYFLVAALMTTVNLCLYGGQLRRLSIALINILLFVAGSALITGQLDFFLFAPPSGIKAAVNYIAAYLLMLVLAVRTVYLVFLSRTDFYLHMDFHFVATLVILMLADYSGIRLPFAMAWLVAAVFFNLLPLFLFYNSGGLRDRFSWPLLGLAFSAVLGIAIGAAGTFPQLTDGAGLVIDALGPGVLFIFRILGSMLIWLLRLGHPAAERQSSAGVPVSSGQNPGTELPATPLMESILNILIRTAAVLLIAAAVILSLYLIGYLLSWLWQRQSPEKGKRVSALVFWDSFFRWLAGRITGLGRLLALCLPGGLSAGKGYLYLLRWGRGKGCPRHEHETPREYCERLKKKQPAYWPELEKITELYIEWRYSQTGYAAPRDVKSLVRRLYLPKPARELFPEAKT